MQEWQKQHKSFETKMKHAGVGLHAGIIHF